MSSRNGYIGSLLVHLGIIAAAVLLARLKPEAHDVDAQDPLLLEVWTGDGSERAPGIPGKERGVASGHASGNKLKTGMPRIRTVDSDKIIRDLKAAEARAAAEEKAAREAKPEKAAPDKSSKPDKKESLEDFRKSTGKTTAKPSKSTSTGSTAATASGRTGKTGISGAHVGSATGTGAGEPGFGRANGKGRNGGDGGSGEAIKLFAGDVRGKFQDAYQPLFEEQGGGLDASKDRAIVRVSVSPSGSVTFIGWIHPPSDPLMEKIIRSAIARMPLVRRPPSGSTTTLQIPVNGDVSDV